MKEGSLNELHETVDVSLNCNHFFGNNSKISYTRWSCKKLKI